MVALPRRKLGLEHQIAQADDGVHRRADLVAHVGQEFTLGAGRGLRLLLGLAQFGLVPHALGLIAHRGLQKSLAVDLDPCEQDGGREVLTGEALVHPLKGVGSLAHGRLEYLLGLLGGGTAVRLPLGRVLPRATRHEVCFIPHAEHRDRGRIA